jgi:hypothetical protein
MTITRFLGTAKDIAVCICLAAYSLLAQTASCGSITGSISDERGTPVAGAFVNALGNTLPPASGRAVSGADGRFLINGLPAGAYSVFVQVAGGGLPDPREWSLSPVTAGVKPGQSAAGVQFKLTSGAILPIRLDDSQTLLKTPSAGGTTPDVLIAVKTPGGMPHPAELVSEDAPGRNLTAKRLTVVDENGLAVRNSGTLRPFQHTSGAPDPSRASPSELPAARMDGAVEPPPPPYAS